MRSLILFLRVPEDLLLLQQVGAREWRDMLWTDGELVETYRSVL
ncbi:MAG: hypothetical protein QM784_15440 [Polyangiaceae bacterium]